MAGTPIEIHWTHETLLLSTQPTDTNLPAGNFDHYAAYNANDTTDASKLNNWHYRGLATNWMFPLVSKTWPNGTTYKTTGLDFGNNEMWTDAFGCHGTSGSGVFNQNSNQVLGPVVHGFANGRLCLDAVNSAPGAHNLSYVRPFLTRQLEPLVAFDR